MTAQAFALFAAVAIDTFLALVIVRSIRHRRFIERRCANR